MRGVGEIFEMYRCGEIDGDDEVGMLHGPADRGYPAQTVALVNLRHACRAGALTGRVAAAAGTRIVAAAKALPFMLRSWDDLALAVGEQDRPALTALAAGIDSGEWDLKRQDALAALHAVAAGDRAAPAPPAVTFPGISRHQCSSGAPGGSTSPAAGAPTWTCSTRPGSLTRTIRPDTSGCC